MESNNPFIQDVSAADFQQSVLQKSHEVPVVVDFWAEWCGPCKTLGPSLEKLTEEANGAFVLAKVDVDSNQELAAQFNVQSIPTVVGFRDGAPVDQFTGALPENAIVDWLNNLLPSELDQIVESARDAAIAGNVETAERLLRAVLEHQPDHQDAGIGFANLLMHSNRHGEASQVLDGLAQTNEVEKLRSALRVAASANVDIDELHRGLEADPNNEGLRVELALALAGRNDYEQALEHLITVIRSGGPGKEQARKAIIDVFDVLGDGHPLTTQYRRQLASALF